METGAMWKHIELFLEGKIWRDILWDRQFGCRQLVACVITTFGDPSMKCCCRPVTFAFFCNITWLTSDSEYVCSAVKWHIRKWSDNGRWVRKSIEVVSGINHNARVFAHPFLRLNWESNRKTEDQFCSISSQSSRIHWSRLSDAPST